MSQTLHIFRKDVRRLWVEISISLIALALVTWIEWWLCTPASNPHWYNEVLPFVVLFFSWWFMVVRLIHGEALVGDRQFWITRPYVWYKLLAAKVLFVFAFVGVPIAISQAVLLVADRAPLTPYLGHIILDVWGAMLVGILPVAALAVITRNLAQWMMCAVLVILSAVGVAWLDSYIPNSHVPTGTDTELVQAVAFACLTALGITAQYARRKRLLGTLAVAAGGFALPLIMVATPYRGIIARAFPPASSEQIPFQVAFVANQGPVAAKLDTGNERTVTVAIPVEISGVSDGTLLQVNGVMLSLDTPDGRRWESEWLPGYEDVLKARSRLSLSVGVDRTLYERVKALPTPARLSLAFNQLRDKHRQHIVVRQAFELPGVGHCWIERDGDGGECRSTENGPPFLLVVASEDESTCSIAGGGPSETGHIIRTMDSSFASGPTSPLIWRRLYLRGQVCPGSALTFSTPEPVRRFRLELEIGQLRLGEYAVHRSDFVLQ